MAGTSAHGTPHVWLTITDTARCLTAAGRWSPPAVSDATWSQCLGRDRGPKGETLDHRIQSGRLDKAFRSLDAWEGQTQPLSV